MLSDVATGVAFAGLTPTPVPPVSYLPATDTIVSGSVVVDGTGATIVGADGAAGVIGAETLCTVATAGTCAVATAAVFGVGYGVYKAIHWAFGTHHVTQSAAPAGTTYNSLCTTLYGAGTAYPADSIGKGECVNDYQHYSAPSNSATTTYSTQGLTIYLGSPPNDGASYPITGQVTCPDGWVGYNGVSGGTMTNARTYAQGWAAGGTGFQWDVSAASCSGHGSALSAVKTTFAGRTFIWNADGSGPAALPSHTVKTDIACLDGNGDGLVSSHALSYSPSFTDADTSIPDTPAVACPTGTIPGTGTITETTTGSPDAPLYTVPAPDIPAGNPCAVVGANCAPTLQQWTSGAWQIDTTDAPSSALDGGTYRCEWLGPGGTPDGGALPMTDCVAATGAADPTPTGNGQPHDGSDDCFPNGWGIFNPREWIEKPVKCALEWAFVPGTAATTQLQTDLNVAQSKPPFSLALGLGAWLSPFANLGQSCPDWTVHVAGTDFGLLCSSSFIQKIHDDRPVFLVLMLVTAFGGFLWSLWYAMIPVFRVSPSSRALEGFGDSGGAELSPIGGTYNGDQMLDAWEAGLDEGRGGG